MCSYYHTLIYTLRGFLSFTTHKFNKWSQTHLLNLRNIAYRIRLLDIIYNNFNQHCIGLEDKIQGYGVRYRTERQYVRELYPHMEDAQIEVPIHFKENMNKKTF